MSNCTGLSACCGCPRCRSGASSTYRSRDLHQVPGKRVHLPVDAIESLVSAVRRQYPTALAEGACGTYSFTVDDVLVAEAWMHPTRPGWWLRIKEA